MSAVERPTDGPDSELAAANDALSYLDAYARSRDHAHSGDARRWVEAVRAVLARPAAGRDLTAQDVQRAYDGTMRWEPIADYLNRIARPAVARTDGQTPADDPPPPSPDPRGDGLCPNCPTDLATLDSGHGVCIECGWTSEPGKCMELYNRIDELENELHSLRAAPAGDTAAPDAPRADWSGAWAELTGYVRAATEPIDPARIDAYMVELKREALRPFREWWEQLAAGQPVRDSQSEAES